MSLSSYFLRKIFLIRKVFLTKKFRQSYSQFGEDVELHGIFRKRIKKGVYVDVGCYHPFKYNNTYRLYRRGWRGVNIDAEALKIEAFKMVRWWDTNIVSAISDQEGSVTLCSPKKYSVVSTIDPDIAEQMKKDGPVQETILQSRTLNAVLATTPYKDKKIDLLTIDCEGHDLNVLRSIDLEKYAPKIVLIETHLQTIEHILQSSIFKHMKNAEYTLVNWVGFTTFYAHKDFSV